MHIVAKQGMHQTFEAWCGKISPNVCNDDVIVIKEIIIKEFD